MLYGDGNLIKRETALRTGKWRIELCEGDLRVVRAYRKLTLDLFNVKAAIRDRITWYEAYYCSRIVYEFMTHVGEHPNGKKTGRLRVPQFAKQYSDTLRGFIAGLFSVEGSVTFASNVRLQVEMLEPALIRELYSILKKFGLRFKIYHYQKDGKTMHGLRLYGSADCQAFLSKIGPIGKRRKQLTSFLNRKKGRGLSPEAARWRTSVRRL